MWGAPHAVRAGPVGPRAPRGIHEPPPLSWAALGSAALSPTDVGDADFCNFPRRVEVSFHQNKQCSGPPLPVGRAGNPTDQALEAAVLTVPRMQDADVGPSPGIGEVWAFLPGCGVATDTRA